MFYLMHLVIQVWDKGNKIKRTVSFPLALYFPTLLTTSTGTLETNVYFINSQESKIEGTWWTLFPSSPPCSHLQCMSCSCLPPSSLRICLACVFPHPDPLPIVSSLLPCPLVPGCRSHTHPPLQEQSSQSLSRGGGALPAPPPSGCACEQELPVAAELPSGIYTFSSKRGTGTLGNKSK